MKGMISRVFSRKNELSRNLAGHSSLSSELTTRDIENYYQSVIVDCLKRMMLPANSFEVAVRRYGRGPGGVGSYAGYLRILKWDAVVTPVMLQNLPVIDARIRKVVDASVILEGTRFAGLWVQAGSAVEGSPTALLGVPCELVHQPCGIAAAN